MEGDMKNRQKQIGFSHRIRLEWLQYTANPVLAGNDKGAAVRDDGLEMLKTLPRNDRIAVHGGTAMVWMTF